MKQGKLALLELLKTGFPEFTEKELYSMIMCGEVKVSGETVRDPRRKFTAETEPQLSVRKWVSRGGEKLDYALSCWNIEVSGKTVLDAGSSTGGFTDCLLQRGADSVYAVDVGYNQLDYRLRTDSRVKVMERTNIMAVENLIPVPDFAVADLSFRSITGAATRILSLTSANLLVALIKPQFEISAAEDFDGIIRDEAVLYDVLLNTAGQLADEGVRVNGVLKSPIKGGKGNTEFLFRMEAEAGTAAVSNRDLIEEFIKSQ